MDRVDIACGVQSRVEEELVGLAAAEELVVAEAAVKLVFAAIAMHDVVAIAAVDDVVPGAAVDEVVAVAAKDAGLDGYGCTRSVPGVDVGDRGGALVVAAAAVQLIVPVEPVDRVGSRAALHVVVAAGLRGADRSVGAHERGGGHKPVVALAAVELVVALPAEELIVPGAAVELSHAGRAVGADEVVATPAVGVHGRLG